MDEIETPALVVDLDIMEANIDKMTAFHCCTTVNLHDVIYAVRNGKVEDVWRVAGRGRFV